MDLKTKLERFINDEAEKRFTCEKPCDSYGVCQECSYKKVFKQGALTLLPVVELLIKQRNDHIATIYSNKNEIIYDQDKAVAKLMGIDLWPDKFRMKS